MLPGERGKRAVVAGAVDVRDRHVREARAGERVAIGAAAAADEDGHAGLDHAFGQKTLQGPDGRNCCAGRPRVDPRGRAGTRRVGGLPPPRASTGAGAPDRARHARRRAGQGVRWTEGARARPSLPARRAGRCLRRTSGIAPLELARTGAPAAIASASTMPNCSSQSGVGRLPSTTHDAAANTDGISEWAPTGSRRGRRGRAQRRTAGDGRAPGRRRRSAAGVNARGWPGRGSRRSAPSPRRACRERRRDARHRERLARCGTARRPHRDRTRRSSHQRLLRAAGSGVHAQWPRGRGLCGREQRDGTHDPGRRGTCPGTGSSPTRSARAGSRAAPSVPPAGR